jgi:hypothetical protein
MVAKHRKTATRAEGNKRIELLRWRLMEKTADEEDPMKKRRFFAQE